MAEPTGREIEFNDPQLGNITVFSTDGQDRTAKQFFDGVKTLKSTGRMPEGITHFQTGSLGQVARDAFESVRSTVQPAAEAIGKVGTQAAAQVPLYPAQLLGLISQQRYNKEITEAGQAGATVGRVAASPLNTPESAATAIGSAVGGLATGGMGIPAQMLATGAGAGIGSLLGGTVNAGVRPGRALVEAGMAAAGQGVFGALRSLTTGGLMSTKAQQGVSKELLDIIKKEVPEASVDSGALNAWGSSSANVQRAVQIGASGFREDIGNMADDLVQQVQARAPNTLSRTGASQLRGLAEKYYNAGNALLDATGDVKATDAAKQALNGVQAEIWQVIQDEYPKMTSRTANAVNQNMMNVLSAMKKQTDDLNGAAEVLGALKRSGADKGFDARKFQQEIQGYFQRSPEEAMQEAGRAAFRGAAPEAMDTTRRTNFALPVTVPILGKMGINLPRGSLGTSYAGQVQSRYPAAAGASASQIAIEQGVRDFLRNPPPPQGGR